MKAMNCPQEAIVSKAVLTGNMGEFLIAHAATCAVCREIIQTANWMQAIAESSERYPALPDPSLVWWRARFSEDQAKAERSCQVLEWVEIVSIAAILLGVAGWISWHRVAIQSFAAWTVDGAPDWLSAYTMPAVFIPIAAALCLIALVLVYPILVDE